MTNEIVAHLKQPALAIIKGVGHLPNLEAESQFNTALATFLRAHAPADW